MGLKIARKCGLSKYDFGDYCNLLAVYDVVNWSMLLCCAALVQPNDLSLNLM